MYSCPICDKEFKGFKSLHGHMLRSHPDEFRERKCLLSSWGIRFDPALEEKSNSDPDPEQQQPIKKHIRLLNLNDPAEAAAYNYGFRYVDDDDNLYRSKKELNNEH